MRKQHVAGVAVVFTLWAVFFVSTPSAVAAMLDAVTANVALFVRGARDVVVAVIEFPAWVVSLLPF